MNLEFPQQIFEKSSNTKFKKKKKKSCPKESELLQEEKRTKKKKGGNKKFLFVTLRKRLQNLDPSMPGIYVFFLTSQYEELQSPFAYQNLAVSLCN